MLFYKLSQKDAWIGYQLAGKPLSKILYDIKGEFHKGERVYSVNIKDLI